MKLIDKNNKKTNFNSLNQGLGILSERKNNLYSLKNKINHSKDNLVEGFIGRKKIIEGFCEDSTEKQNCLETEYKNTASDLQTDIGVYTDLYTTFLVRRFLSS
jgi:hypothetical protein